MNDDLFGFEWAKDENGYLLVRQRRQPRASHILGITADALTGDELIIRRKGGALKSYPPRAVQALHLKFTNLPDDPNAVLAFVSQYGFLGVGGSPVADIKQESVADILASRDRLRSVYAYLDENARLVRAIRRTAREMIDEGKEVGGDPGEFNQIAAGLFNQWAGEQLKHMHLKLVTAERRGKAAVTWRVSPGTLLSSFWLDTAEEIAGGRRARLCAWCGNPIAPEARAGKRTCSDACRQKLSRSERSGKKPKARQRKERKT